MFEVAGYQRVALADIMKQALLVLDPIVPHRDALVDRLSDLVENLGWEGAKQFPEVRRLLQVFGTEVGRNMLGEDIWIEALAQSVKGFYSDSGPRVIISDVRFLNEAAFIRRLRGDVYKVVRPNFDNGVGIAHASEREIGAIHPDATFINDLDESHLKKSVERFIAAKRYWDDDQAAV